MKTVQFIACSHNESQWNRPFIQSMQMQTVLRNERQSDWSAIVFNNGPGDEMKNACYGLKNLIYRESVVDTGNYGTTNRQTAINECTADYIIQTSVQDYWLPQAVEYILQGLNQHEPDILIWNSINHLVGPCQVLDAQLAWSKADWGNFAIRTDIAKKVGIKHGEQYCADFAFITDVLNSGLVDHNKILKLNAILTVHN